MIAHRPVNEKSGKGANIPNAVIETALKRHPDGFGLSWREDGQLRVAKFGPHEASEFRAALKAIDKDQTIEYVAHFRMATHGDKCADLAHPFVYEDEQEGEVAFFHNGIVSIATPKDGSESDTSMFVAAVISKLPSRWWDSDAHRLLVDLAGGWSKFVMMTATETINLNEDDGNWDRGIWYSSDHRPSAFDGIASGKGGTYLGTRQAGWYDADTKTYRRYDDYDDEGWEAIRDAYLEERAAEDRVTPLLGSGIRSAESARYRVALDNPDVEWTHGGHALDLMLYDDPDLAVDGDYMDSVMCSECYTIGDIYIIGGTAYIDLAHEVSAEEEEASLA